MKIEQRKLWEPEWGPQVEQTAVLASPIYIGQAQGEEKKHIKRGAKGQGPLSPTRVLSLSPPCAFSLSLSPARALSVSFSLSLYSSCLLGWHALTPWGCIFLLFSKQNWAITQSCNTVRELWCAKGFNVHHFKFLLWQDKTKEITLPWQFAFFIHFIEHHL